MRRAWEPCTCGEEIETDCIGVEGRAAFREDESHARGQAGVKWGVRPAERPRPTHCVHPRSWCQLSGVFVRGDAVVGRAAKGGVEGTPAALTERTSVLECAVGGIGVGRGGLEGHMVQRRRALFHATHAQSLTSRSAVSPRSKGNGYKSGLWFHWFCFHL